jgi:hypothetical protein
MVTKRILCPDRLRRIPRQFSWVDHSLVRNQHIRGLSPDSLGLYLFLVTVSDADGLSFYSDAATQRYLSLGERRLVQARLELCTAGLIAYSRPLYQVLSLEKNRGSLPAAPCEYPASRGGGEPVSIGHILQNIGGGIK